MSSPEGHRPEKYWGAIMQQNLDFGKYIRIVTEKSERNSRNYSKNLLYQAKQQYNASVSKRYGATTSGVSSLGLRPYKQKYKNLK